jgi:predicted ATP-grasp superfamily ATP-dependent carboligase
MSADYERIIYFHEPDLHDPVLIVGLEGWVDAGFGANAAVNSLLTTMRTELLASLETDYFIDQRARRPVVKIVNGVTTNLTWPEIQVHVGVDGDGADVLMLVGPEPDFHWGDFVELVVDLCDRLGVRMVVGLGAFPGPVPHTRPLRVVGTAPLASEHLLSAVTAVDGELEVPAGIMAAIEMGCAEAGIDVITLWARVPHYVASMPYPLASAALVDAVAAVSGLTVSSVELRARAEEARQRIDDLVTNNPDHESMVHSLESQADEEEPELDEPLPTGEELAEELERFLRGEESD